MPLATHASYFWNSSPPHPSSVSPKGFFDVPCPNRSAPQGAVQGARKGHVALRTLQTGMTNSWPMRHPAVRQGMKTGWHLRPYVVALAIAPLLLAGCAELGEFRMDIARLRADLHATTQTFSQLSARVDELERRQVDMESTARQTQHELSQAIDVLLRRALMTENRPIIRESGKSQSPDTARLERALPQLPGIVQDSSPRGENAHQARKDLSLGMTQDEVRRTLGEPISIDNAGDYVFWQYSETHNQKYVIFQKASGQVSGWRGL
jgi:outer membrane murein-binding lipoprotein Lpp